VVRIIHFGNLTFFIDEQRYVVQAVFGDELAVRFGRVARQTEDFDLSCFVFRDVLLKLNKLANSDAGVVFGVKGEHNGMIIFENITQFPQFAVLVGQCEIDGGLTGCRRCGFDVRSGTGTESQQYNRDKEKSCLSHKFFLSMLLGLMKTKNTT
jgi:hypothetical protein